MVHFHCTDFNESTVTQQAKFYEYHNVRSLISAPHIRLRGVDREKLHFLSLFKSQC